MAAPRPLVDDEGQPSSGSPLQVGQIVSGKYRIERQIGRGGMGIVLAATHLQLENLVAIKVMRRDLAVDDKVLDRLLMEARSAARIRSEHVARVLDVGMLDNGSPFIVMEYLEGENLADLLDREGALQIQQAAAFMLQCCLALAEVHVAEMVHRDLKPGNLFIARLPDGSPSVKIVDFGISKYIGGAAPDGATTTSPQVLGSPYYMSPEQMRAEAVDERSDIWGLGAILFEMLTGRPPFIGDALPEVFSAVLNDSPPPVDSLRPGVPVGLDDIVQRCLEKNPAQRFCDVADLAEALGPYAGTSAHLVERVTRILTNPDAARVRRSLLPAAEASGAMRVMARPVREGDSSEPRFGDGFDNRFENGEGMMGNLESDDDGAEQIEPEVVEAPRAQTMLEADVSDAPWRPSRPSTGDLAPFSATGASTGRFGGLAKWRFGGLGVGLALVLVIAGFWLTRAPREDEAAPAPVLAATPAEPVAPGEPVEPTVEQTSEPTPAAPEPRVTPIVDARLAHPGAPVQTKVQSLQPVARAKPQPAKPSSPPASPKRNTGGTVAASNDLAASPGWDEPNAGEGSPAPAARAAAPARPGSVHVEDPWNPDAFGDRR